MNDSMELLAPEQLRSTILDNSDGYRHGMLANLRSLFAGQPSEVCVAVGYADLAALALLADELQAFLERGGRARFLFGREMMVYASMLDPDRRRDKANADSLELGEAQRRFILKDIEELTVDERHANAAGLILEACRAALAREGKATQDDEDAPGLSFRVYRHDDQREPRTLHAKCYIFLYPEGARVGVGAKGIIGSSNLTRRGLTDNLELNFLDVDSAHVLAHVDKYCPDRGHLEWFNALWRHGENMDAYLEESVAESPWGREYDRRHALPPTLPGPYEVYIAALRRHFADALDPITLQNVRDIIAAVPGYTAYRHQVEGVAQALSIMQLHGGFLIGDVVGLGKTLIGALVVRLFLERANLRNTRPRRVLVIAPPAILDGWQRTFGDLGLAEQIDRPAKQRDVPFATKDIVLLSSGKVVAMASSDDDVDPELPFDDDDDEPATSADSQNNNDPDQIEPAGEYGLIVIDESHRFRNQNTAMYKALQSCLEGVHERCQVYPYVGLLSATPQNNRPRDLRNQLFLFQHNQTNSSLPGGLDLKAFFAQADKDFLQTISAELPPEQQREGLRDIADDVYNSVLRHLMVRRTRRDVAEANGPDDIKLTFPTIQGPDALQYEMNDDMAELFDHTLQWLDFQVEQGDDDGLNHFHDDEQRYGYFLYRGVEFLTNPALRLKHTLSGQQANLTPERIALQLATIMQMQLVKRLDSSAAAFVETLQRQRQKVQIAINLYDEHDCVFLTSQEVVNIYNVIYDKGEADGEVTPEKVRKIAQRIAAYQGSRHTSSTCTRNDFDPEWRNGLERDLNQLDQLIENWTPYTEVDNDPKLQRLLEQLPTMLSAERNAPGRLVLFTEAVATAYHIETGLHQARPELNTLVVTSDNRDDKKEEIRQSFDPKCEPPAAPIHVLLTTDVLAEGVDLHRANSIVNYDEPWNTTRLIQRIGRVNRLGSREANVWVYNFMPSAETDGVLELLKRSRGKMQSFHYTFGSDDQVLLSDEELIRRTPGGSELQHIVEGDRSRAETLRAELTDYRQRHRERFDYIVSEQRTPEELTCRAPQGIPRTLAIERKPECYYIQSEAVVGTEEALFALHTAFDDASRREALREEVEADMQPLMKQAGTFIDGEEFRNDRAKSKHSAEVEGLIKRLERLGEELRGERLAARGRLNRLIKELRNGVTAADVKRLEAWLADNAIDTWDDLEAALPAVADIGSAAEGNAAGGHPPDGLLWALV